MFLQERRFFRAVKGFSAVTSVLASVAFPPAFLNRPERSRIRIAYHHVMNMIDTNTPNQGV